MKNRYLPFGYKIADGKIVADSEQVEAVRRIFDAYTAGQTFQQIADALSAQGIPYRSDASRWNKNMVSRILANADYCGTAEYPQIITAGQFEAAEQIRKSKTVTYSATLKPFRKDMHCGCCGARLLAANFTDEVAAQINGILHDIQTGESAKPNLQEQLEQTQQEFDRLLEMSLDFDEDTPFLDDRLKKLNSKIKSLKKGIEDSAARQEKIGQPEMLLSAKDMQIQEYDDTLTARIIEKITVRSRNEIEIRFIGGYKKTMQLI